VTDVVIATKDLRKSYGSVDAVRGLDLEVPRGAICGFLGRNGAGKTTTLKMLLGLTRRTSGVAQVFGRDVEAPGSGVAIRARTAFVSDEKDLYDSMTVAAMVRFTASFHPRWRRDLEALYLRRFELPADRRVKTLSRGMRTRLAVLLALCRDAELLMLDEPTAGLDPVAAEEVLQAIVSQVAGSGTTVFFSSHQLADVEQIADDIVIIDRGRAVVGGSIDTLRKEFRRIHLVFADDAPAHVFATPGVRGIRRDGRTMSLLASGAADLVLAEARTLGPTSVDVTPVTVKEIFLESVATEE
jgi:ABC-type multidrug transport system ATPase subunit